MPDLRLARRAAALAPLVAIGAALLPAPAAAHPLGNFTINHYAELRIEPDRVSVDLVLDMAEIPTFEERRALDLDADGEVSEAELARAPEDRCTELAAAVSLSLDGRALALVLRDASLTFPPGLGAIPTMRLECELVAAFDGPLAEPAALRFEDGSHPDRIGWREIVVTADGVAIETDAPSESISDRLTAYPTDLLAAPADQRSAVVLLRPAAASAGAPTPVVDRRPASVIPIAASLPGGVGDELAALLAVEDLTPLAVMATLLLAAGFGAAHALSPGHGKTVMAAYLVGSRGTARHAIALGAIVTLSHTLGVLALGLLILSATVVVPPERLVPALATLSGVLFVAIGGWMLRDQLRARRDAPPDAHAHPHPHADAGHGHPDAHPHAHDHGHEHAHGPFRHRHAPAGELSWRRLAALGLVGGLVPSIPAVVLLLGSAIAGRPAYGLVLVVAFGAGMAAVLAGIGIALVHARAFVERRVLAAGATSARWVGAVRNLPIAASLVVIAAGLWAAGSSLGGFSL
ncbi:MAG TPA: hypothetical protein VFK54_05005 [Candidatus Limnocylindrales bacterium]|nr:hypothetical protein [Candidatus Limnocylindrales bacterium]